MDITTIAEASPSARRIEAVKTRRRWYRRPIIVVPVVLLVLLLAVGGVLGLRIRETLSTVHAVSTPAPEISAASLGGDETITIDTGPARAALATAEAGGRFTSQGAVASETPTATPTPTPPPATPDGTPVAEGTAQGSPVMAASPTVAAAASATPSATASATTSPTVIPTDAATSSPTATARAVLPPEAPTGPSATAPAMATATPVGTSTASPTTEPIRPAMPAAPRPGADATATVVPATPASRPTQIPTTVRPATPTAPTTASATATQSPLPTATATTPAIATTPPTAPSPPLAAATATEVATAIETALPTETAVPTETVVPTSPVLTAPTETPVASPTSEPTAVATPAPDVIASPTSVLSEIERVLDGGFEDGSTSWYLEGDAEAVASGAQSGAQALRLGVDGYADQGIEFIVETTYQLSAWGVVGADGEAGQVGVVYLDAAGTRLTDLEPEPLRFTETDYVQQTLPFTPPAGTAQVKIYLWNETQGSDFTVDDVSVRSIVPESVLSAQVDPALDEALNVLVMGVDARPGEAIDVDVRPDSLMVVRLNPETGSCHLLAIPRDTRTDLPGYGLTKINHALAVGGIEYQQLVVEELLDIRIDNYVLIDFTGFEELVDAIGGVTIIVPDGFIAGSGMEFQAGEQRFNGKQALEYARWRGGADGDFGRIARQQQILRALVRKASALNVIRSINELLPAVEGHVRTDLDVGEMASIGNEYRESCPEESITMARLEGYDAMFDDPLLQLPLYYVVVDEAEIRRKVADLLAP